MKLNIYYLQNPPYMRYHGHFFTKFSKLLSSNHDCNVDVSKGDKKDSKWPVTIKDVDMFIENAETKKFVIVSASNQIGATMGMCSKIPEVSKIYMCHFNQNYIYKHLIKEKKVNRLSLYEPLFFPMSDDLDFEKYYKDRKSVEKYIDKIHFRGTGIGSHRQTIKEFLKFEEFAGGYPMDYRQFYPELIKYKMAMAFYVDFNLNWYGEFCYRDTEFMALGIPYIRLEYRNTCHDPIIPNKHYISVDRETAYLAYEKEGNYGVAKAHIDRFNEVKDDADYLSWVANNGREYYLKNCNWPNSGLNLMSRIEKDLS